MKKPDTPARRTAILLIHCPDRRGIVAAVAQFLNEHGGNIIDLDEHVDHKDRVFSMRAEWEIDGFAIPPGEIGSRFGASVADRFGMEWRLHLSDEVPRMAVFVSKLPHCLYDILSRCQSGEWDVEVPLVVSNHPDLESVARTFGIDFHVFPISESNRAAQERKELALLRKRRVDLVVLARYMRILSPEMLAAYPERIINIHHSFLPAFPGARPYHSAYERGVKIIGATSHYATEELDAGPILEQDVAHVSHRDSVGDLIRKGRDLEKVVLARGIWHHLQRRVLVYDNRTVIFD